MTNTVKLLLEIFVIHVVLHIEAILLIGSYYVYKHADDITRMQINYISRLVRKETGTP